MNPWAFNEWSSKEIYSNGFRLAEKFGMKTTDPKAAYDFLKTIDAKKLIEADDLVRISALLSNRRNGWIGMHAHDINKL